MRYIGGMAAASDGTLDFLLHDSTVRANMIDQASRLNDTDGKDLLEIAEASSYGGRQKYVRFLEGAAIGAALALVLRVVLKKESKRWKRS